MKTDRDINFYIEQAMEKGGYSSYRKLQTALGYTGNQVVFMRKGQSLPSPEKMVLLSKIGGIDPAIALMDLAMWNTQGEAKQTYANILEKISKTACIALASSLVFTSSAKASPTLSQIQICKANSEILYVMVNKLFTAIRGVLRKSLFLNINTLFTFKSLNIRERIYCNLNLGVS